MKKPTKKQLFYSELRKLIHSKVTYNLENIEEIKQDVENYIETQKHLKRVSKAIWDDSIFMFVIAEKMLDLIIDNLDILIKNKVIYPFNYQNYLHYIENKIRFIGSNKIYVLNSDVVTNRFTNVKAEKIKDVYYNYNDNTRKQKRVLDLIDGILKLEKLKGLNESIDTALENTKNELNELLAE